MPRSPAEKEPIFTALVEKNRNALFRLCRYYERDSERRRDLEQEIWVALWRSLDAFRGDASARTWLFRVAHNVGASWSARDRRRRAEVGELVDEPDPKEGEEQLLRRARLARLEATMRTLDLPSQQICLLHLEGFTAAEIGEVAGLTETNVRTRLSRIRKKLSDAEHERGRP